MNIRLGYVAISLALKDCSTSKTVTLLTLNNIENHNNQLHKLNSILKSNLDNLLRILKYNVAYGIHVYRISSKIVPFSTHELVKDWNYIKEFKETFKQIGNYVKKNNIRISAHPDHYTVINACDDCIFERSVSDLKYLNSIFNAMELDDKYKLVTHVGGFYKDKEKSMIRFIQRFKTLPIEIKNRMVLENDDKIYNVKDVLGICKEINIPMVLDIHHHNCNNINKDIIPYLTEIFDTWNNQKIVPKIHFSSPKSHKEYRSHSTDINTKDFFEFLKQMKVINRDFDVMLEVKNKDMALFKLIEELKEYKQIKIVGNSQIKM